MFILSYNVLADCTTDYLLREGIPFEYLVREHRTPLVSDILKQADADVICLQEVDQQAFDDYSNALKETHTGVLHLHRRFGNACFWKNNLHVVSTVPYKFTDQSGRVAQCIDFSDFVVYNVHLSFSFNTFQAEELVHLMDKLKPVLVCGDFNASPASDTILKFTSMGFDFKLTSFTNIKCNDKKVIDFILSYNCSIESMRTLYTISGQCPNKESGSDHSPILAKVSYYTRGVGDTQKL